ncbi:MAG: LegC family aminotransferase [Bdellovibrionaceae bacterium]|nr:LegC family aminotransferase [Pseudobdellovibrionaceae bacterium]
MFSDSIEFIKSLYPEKKTISLHEPVFVANERKYVLDSIDSTFVSSVGPYVTKFEKDFADYIKSPFAIVTSNGTLALHAALHLIGVKSNDEVITQALTFVATANAITYGAAFPVFVDSDPSNLGMSVESLQNFLAENTTVEAHQCINKKTGRVIRACVPMHVFGHPVEIEKIVQVCSDYHIPVVEDAAESVGSLYRNQHTGVFGKIGVFSFNGNKIITSGGGGMIVTSDPEIARRAKHITTTAKVPHAWNFHHDELGFNYRMPNINAALACAQLEKIEEFVANKRRTADLYRDYFSKKGIEFLTEPQGARSNYWLNAIFLKDKKERDLFLQESNSQNVHTRPVWDLLPTLPMYKDRECTDLKNAKCV